MAGTDEGAVTERELPCKKTGKACEWVWEYTGRVDGEPYEDLMCKDCYRWRDFDKEEYVEES